MSRRNELRIQTSSNEKSTLIPAGEDAATTFKMNESVLCYETDPHKVKLLYDSKVVKIFNNDQNDGFLYMVHFSGWREAWNRLVTEDYLLKDDADNRILQKELAEKSGLILDGYTYRKSPKKGDALTAVMPAQKRRIRNEDKDSDYTPKIRRRIKAEEAALLPAEIQEERALPVPSLDVEPRRQMETTAATTAVAVAAAAADEDSTGEIEILHRRHLMYIPGVLKKALGSSQDRIRNKGCGQLISLPASPNIVQILEGFVHYYVENHLWNGQQRYKNYYSLVSKVNFCKEMMDGMRILFDFSLSNLFLYEEEKEQFQKLDVNIKKWLQARNEMGEEFDESSFVESVREFEECRGCHHNVAGGRDVGGGGGLVSREKTAAVLVAAVECQQPGPSGSSRETTEGLERERENEKIAKNSKKSTNCAYNLRLNNNMTSKKRMMKSFSDKEVSRWRLIPTEMLGKYCAEPSYICGAFHLIRVLTKFPEILQYSILKEKRIETLFKYMDVFMKYLAHHEEWFDDNEYFSKRIHK